MTSVEFFGILKDIVLASAAGTTAVVAYKGLERWQKELKGRASFETARELSRSTYKLRNEIEAFRSSFIRGSEFPEDYYLTNERSPEKEGKAYAHIYTKRWEPVSIAVQEFDASSLEAEALWGADIREKTNSLRMCVVELQVATEAVIDDQYSGGKDFQDKDFAREVRGKVSGIKSEENPLTLKINSAIQAIETEIKPHLDRS